MQLTLPRDAYERLSDRLEARADFARPEVRREDPENGTLWVREVHLGGLDVRVRTFETPDESDST